MNKYRIAFVYALIFVLTALAAQTKPDALKKYQSRLYGEAIEICLAEIKDSPSNLDSYVVLCWSLVKAGRYDEAESWAEQGRKISRYDPRLIEIHGEALYFKGMNAEALTAFQDYVLYAPNGSRIADAYYFMGEIYLRQEQYQHADIAFCAALQYRNSDSLYWSRLGYAREKAREYRFALDAYQTALSFDPGSVDAAQGRNRMLQIIR